MEFSHLEFPQWDCPTGILPFGIVTLEFSRWDFPTSIVPSGLCPRLGGQQDWDGGKTEWEWWEKWDEGGICRMGMVGKVGSQDGISG